MRRPDILPVGDYGVQAAIFDRFTALAGDPLTPKGILKLTDAEMRSVGCRGRKPRISSISPKRPRPGLLEFERLPELPEEEVIAHLTQVKIRIADDSGAIL